MFFYVLIQMTKLGIENRIKKNREEYVERLSKTKKLKTE